MNVVWKNDAKRRSYRLQLIACVSVLAILACWAVLSKDRPETGRRGDDGRSRYQAPSGRGLYGTETVEAEVRSAFSHIRVKKEGSILSLVFVRDNGVEAVETMVDLRNPHHLLIPYTQSMFASYLFKTKQQRVLIVGLGGGAMVHFLEHHAPQLKVDVLEIDPAVVKIADEYFQTRSSENVKIITADGFKYLEETKQRYDVIYMDAFLKPSAETDGTGMPLRMKTIRFFKGIQKKLAPDGLVVFNLNVHRTTANDLNTIRGAFPQVYVFPAPPRSGNLVAVASLVKARQTASALMPRASELDRSFQANFSFQQMVKDMVR